jgi:hypothetical protein
MSQASSARAQGRIQLSDRNVDDVAEIIEAAMNLGDEFDADLEDTLKFIRITGTCRQ